MEHHQNSSNEEPTRRVPWNKGKIVGAKPSSAAESRVVDQNQTANGKQDA